MSNRITPIALLAVAPVALVLVLMVAVKAGAGGSARKEADGFALMSAGDLARILGQKDVAVFDANTDEVFASARVPGAVHLAEFKDYPASVLPADKATRVIFYCKNTH
jgi:hypothetical protein